MGIFKDTYNITKIDTKGIERELERKNDIQERQLLEEIKTKDRVNISLTEYEQLKEELKKSKELNIAYNNFIQDLGKSIKQSPDILLKSKVIKSEFERVPYKDSYDLLVVWEIGKNLVEEQE